MKTEPVFSKTTETKLEKFIPNISTWKNFLKFSNAI